MRDTGREKYFFTRSAEIIAPLLAKKKRDFFVNINDRIVLEIKVKAAKVPKIPTCV
jgi:hypothetical protein